MGWYNKLPRLVRDLIIFNSFIFMMRGIIIYGFGHDFEIRSDTLMAANVGLMIVFLFRYRVNRIREEEKAEKEKNSKNNKK